jgi:ribosomal protein L40E
MDFLEDLFDFGDHKRRKQGGFFQNGGHHDEHDDDHDDEFNHRNPYQTDPYSQVSTNPVVFLPGIICRKCSKQTVQGAKFCHECGAAIELIQNCSSCGSKLPADALFCPKCGFRNG